MYTIISFGWISNCSIKANFKFLHLNDKTADDNEKINFSLTYILPINITIFQIPFTTKNQEKLSYYTKTNSKQYCVVRTAFTTFEGQVQDKNHTAMGGLCGFCPAFQTTFDKTQTSYLVQSINPELRTVCYGLVQHPRLSSYNYNCFLCKIPYLLI